MPPFGPCPGSPAPPRGLARRRCRWRQPPAVSVLSQDLSERAEDPSSRCAQRVPDGECTATAVHDGGIDTPGIDARQGLHRERLVELHRANLTPRDSRSSKRDLGSLYRRVAEHLRFQRRRSAARDAGDRNAADHVCCLLRADEQRRCSVVEWRGVAGGDGSVGPK